MAHISTQWHMVGTQEGDMRLFVARPETPSPCPCVVVFQEAFGVNAHIRNVTERIAALGYVAAAPELFHRTAPGFEGDYKDLGKSRPHMDALTPERIEQDIQAVHDWLQTDKQSDAATMAAIGFCLGGKAAFIAGGILPLKAAASFYGSGIPSLLSSYAAKQQAPLLLVWGGRDKHIDMAKRAQIATELNNKDKIFTHVEFSAAGHGFFCEERDTYHPDAAREAWAITAVFLKNKLNPGKD